MEKELFSPMALDALGEMMNISLGSSATAVSNMLDRRVDITTPEVSVVKTQDFTLGKMEPAMGVEIKYVEGLDGSNIMLLKISDIKVIVDILMGTETSEKEFELNELTISCVCELMNQMMGAAATALSDFLGYPVNISTPEPFELDDMDAFKREHMPQDSDTAVVVKFALSIENAALESGFMNVMSVSLAKDLLAGFGLDLDGESIDAPAPPAPAPAPAAPPEPASDGGGGKLSQEEIEKLLAGGGGMDAPAAPEPEPPADSNRKLSQEEIERMMSGGDSAPAPAPAGDSGGGKLSQEEIEKLLSGSAGEPAAAPPPPPPPPAAPGAAPGQQPGQPGGQMPPFYPPMPGPDGAMQGGYMGYPPYYPPYPYPYPPQMEQPQQAAPDPKVISTKPLSMGPLDPVDQLGQEQAKNLDLIMEVPLQVTVEIGRARRKVQDILEFAKGSLVVLDKLAGDQVDLFVNGKIIARGEVVVIEDNFGVRITEIVQTPGIEVLASKAKVD